MNGEGYAALLLMGKQEKLPTSVYSCTSELRVSGERSIWTPAHLSLNATPQISS